MAAAVLKLVMLIALAFMPLGMSPTPASAAVSATAVSTGHCDEHPQPSDAPSAPKAHCAACAALPATQPLLALAELRPAMPLEVEAEDWVPEPGPETDTPPPKLG